MDNPTRNQGAGGALADEVLKEARILVVDDDASVADFLERALRKAGYDRIVTTTESEDALELADSFLPDLVLLDLWMPGMDGFEVMKALRSRQPAGSYMPILALTGDMSEEVAERALEAGAHDFLRKPFRMAETLLRIRNLLETRFLYRRLEEQAGALEARVTERTRQLAAARLELLERIVRTSARRADNAGADSPNGGTSESGALFGVPAPLTAYRFLLCPYDEVPHEQRAFVLRLARGAGMATADLADDPEEIGEDDLWQWQTHIIEPAAERGVISQDDAWRWASADAVERVKEDPRVQAFLVGLRERAAERLLEQTAGA